MNRRKKLVSSWCALTFLLAGSSAFVGVSIILVFTAVNLLSVRWASRAQNLVCGLNLLTMILMLGAGFLWGAGDWDHSKPVPIPPPSATFSARP